MIYILLFALVIMFAIALICSKKDILSPWVISCSVFIISTFIAALNVNKWGFSLSPITVSVILASLLAFGAGELTVNYAFDRHYSDYRSSLQDYQPVKKELPIRVPWLVLLIAFALMIAADIAYFRKTYAMSILGGNQGGYGQMLQYAREYLLVPGNTIGRVWGHISLVFKLSDLIFMFLFFHNVIMCKFKAYDLLYLIPIGLYFVYGMLGTGRTFFIEIIAAALFMGFIFVKRRNNWSNQECVAFVLVAAAGLLCFFIAFTLLGYLTGKSQMNSAYDWISCYAGLSIPSLDSYLTTPHAPNQVIGQETLYGIYGNLRSVGIDSPIFTRPLEFVHFNGTAGNVYTSLRRYINDFGIVGTILVQYALGTLYALLYKYTRYGKFSNYAMILYAFFAFPLVMQSIEENLISVYLSSIFVNILAYTGLLYLIFIYYPTHKSADSTISRRTT